MSTRACQPPLPAVSAPLFAALCFALWTASPAPAFGADLDAEYEALRAGGLDGCAAVESMVAADPHRVYAISEAATRAGLPSGEAIECAANKYAELLAAGAIPPAGDVAAAESTTTAETSADPAPMTRAYNHLQDGGVLGCDAVATLVEQHPDAIDEIVDAASGAGLSRADAAACATEKFNAMAAAGTLPTGADAPTETAPVEADPGADQPAPQLAPSQPMMADSGDPAIAEEFQNLFDEGTVGCPAIEVMVQNHPDAVDEIVDVATRAGIPEDDSIECAARQLAAIGPQAPAAPPAVGDPPGFTPDPPLGEPKIIRPPDPPVGPPNAASPS